MEVFILISLPVTLKMVNNIFIYPPDSPPVGSPFPQLHTVLNLIYCSYILPLSNPPVCSPFSPLLTVLNPIYCFYILPLSSPPVGSPFPQLLSVLNPLYCSYILRLRLFIFFFFKLIHLQNSRAGFAKIGSCMNTGRGSIF